MISRSLTLAAVAALSFAAAGAPDADAGYGFKFRSHHGHSHHFHKHRFGGHYFHGPRISIRIGKVGRRSCGYYYDKWQYTGSRYWKRQYKICKGYW